MKTQCTTCNFNNNTTFAFLFWNSEVLYWQQQGARNAKGKGPLCVKMPLCVGGGSAMWKKGPMRVGNWGLWWRQWSINGGETTHKGEGDGIMSHDWSMKFRGGDSVG